MQELSYHILDLVQNSLTAGSTRVTIRILENGARDLLTIEVEDNGRGMNAEMIRRVANPFVTSRRNSDVGLGLSLLKEAAESCGGGLEVSSQEGKGTKVRARFQLHHVDRAPLGDLGETLETLIAANPEVHFRYHHQVDGEGYRLDTHEMKKVLGSEILNSPEVLDFIRRDIHAGLKKIGAAFVPKLDFPIKEP